VAPLSQALVVGVVNEPRSLPVIRLLIGAAAARVELSLEQIDELEIALETVLASRVIPCGEVVVEIETLADGLELRVGPVVAGAREVVGLPLERILSRLVDSSEPLRRGESEWLALVKAGDGSAGAR
jgi:hypothetical protein